MALSEVFRPSDGDLFVRDTLAHGPVVSVDTYKKEGERRPQTQGGYRFGQLSHNSFFTRHNPHPTRVRHFKGLLDVPICSVNDDGYFANPRYSLQFPPSSFDNTKLKSWKGRIPVNAININSQLHPINTITGVHYFTGFNSYPFREKAIPRVGLVPVTEAWRDELAEFTKNLLLQEEPVKQKPEEEKRPRTSVYSPDTGRLIPPPSRAMTRGGSRRGHQFVGGNFQHISADPDLENTVLMMLCQILQTDDISAVQAWLCSAGQREKDLVMNLVRSAVAGREEYYKQYPVEYLQEFDKSKLPAIRSGTSSETNRLVLDEPSQEPDSNRWQKAKTPPADAGREPADQPVQAQDSQVTPPTTEAFKQTSATARPVTSQKQARALTPLQPARVTKTESAKAPKNSSPKASLKYTKNPSKEPMWSQNNSVSKS
ncbi:protein TBATA-like [Physella acuta]|uniref:protein TBATA-like n=1 Tax=Physella acuta TaxID=109671 RepID=UPI0027DCCE29|nr:protein TBATA-like [Physella acuta]